MTKDPTDAAAALAAAMRREWGRLASLLLTRFRRLDLVEDSLGDAFEIAARHWPSDGVPDNPAAWLLTAARRRILDRLRAEAMVQRKVPLLVVAAEAPGPSSDVGPKGATDDGLGDELLRMALMCSHPALDPAAASALTLRLVLGVTTADIAKLFLVTETTMAARITRAKKKIVAAGIPLALPDPDALPDRLDTLAQTAYLAFTAGYAPSSGTEAVRVELAGEAIRLVRVLIARLPDEPILTALLALMLLQHSRRDARTGPDGEIVLLADQDRMQWHRAEIAEGLSLLASPLLAAPMTAQSASYAIQARIASLHARADRPGSVAWKEIVDWYDHLLEIAPSPGARLARAVAVAEAQGPQAGLDALAGLELPGHRRSAVQAELLVRADRPAEAVSAYDAAIAACDNEAERSHLIARRAAIDPPTGVRP